jgi:SHS2 domain-containing protein
MYELFEHTADMGMRVRATELNQLFVDAARVYELDTLGPTATATIHHSRFDFAVSL